MTSPCEAERRKEKRERTKNCHRHFGKQDRSERGRREIEGEGSGMRENGGWRRAVTGAGYGGVGRVERGGGG